MRAFRIYRIRRPLRCSDHDRRTQERDTRTRAAAVVQECRDRKAIEARSRRDRTATRGLAFAIWVTILIGMSPQSRQMPSAAASALPSCGKCRRVGALSVDPEGTQHVKCTECGEEYVLAQRRRWTLVHPSGTVLTFDSAAALCRALTETPDTDGDDLDDVNLVAISEAPPRIASIPPVPTADASVHLEPPPPPRRTSSSSTPTSPIPAGTGPATIVLPAPSPLPPPSEPMMPARNETIRGLGEPPSSEPAISLRNAFQRGSEDDLVEDMPASDAGPRSDEAPRSDEEPLLLTRMAHASERSSESALEPVTTTSARPGGSTRTSSTTALEDTVKRRRWAPEDDDALALAPPPRRGGWAVAATLVLAAAGSVVYLQHTPATPSTRSSVAATTATPPATAESSIDPVTSTNDPAASAIDDGEPRPSAAGPLPAALLAPPDALLGAPGTSLVPPPARLPATPVSITTTTNAITSPAGPAAALGPVAAEPLSEDLLPISELLHRAHASLREGDRRRAQQRFRLALAKDPSNVEASTGLGDIARAEGDLEAARDHYQRALERSPSFVPALVALADLEWDLGERGAAQKRYAAVFEKLGDRAPARVKERKVDDASPHPTAP